MAKIILEVHKTKKSTTLQISHEGNITSIESLGVLELAKNEILKNMFLEEGKKK